MTDGQKYIEYLRLWDRLPAKVKGENAEFYLNADYVEEILTYVTQLERALDAQRVRADKLEHEARWMRNWINEMPFLARWFCKVFHQWELML